MIPRHPKGGSLNELLLARFAAAGYPEVRASYGSVLVPLFAEDGLRLGELAARSRLSKQAMTGLVKLCERDDLVTRTADAEDGRAYRISLTARGRRFQAVAEGVIAELESRLGARKRDALVRALEGVMDL